MGKEKLAGAKVGSENTRSVTINSMRISWKFWCSKLSGLYQVSKGYWY